MTGVCTVQFGDSAALNAPQQPQQQNVGPAFLVNNGVQIGGGQPISVDDMRDHWANKDKEDAPSDGGLMEVGSMVSQGSNEDRDLIPHK